jgi:hypothetical protein
MTKPVAEALDLDDALRFPLVVLPHRHRYVVLVGRKLHGDLVGDELIGPGVDRAVEHPGVKIRLRLGLGRERNRFPSELRVGAPLRSPQVLVLRTAPFHLVDRHALLLELPGARVPARHHVDLAVADRRAVALKAIVIFLESKRVASCVARPFPVDGRPAGLIDFGTRSLDMVMGALASERQIQSETCGRKGSHP